jgi:hypothetical protein
LGKTVAFPVIGLGLDAAPLKKGLKEAQGFVKGTSFATKAWGVLDSTISKVGNLPKTLSEASLPINQTLELAAKAQRLLGAPLRAQMAMEGGNADVMAGGNLLLGSGTLSGTLARFERSVEDLFANIWHAVDSAFDIQGLIEGLRGGMAGVSAIISAAFGPIDVLGKDPELLKNQFKAGGEFVIDTFGSIAKFSIEIYNSFLDIVKMIRRIPGLGGAEMFNAVDEARIAQARKDAKQDKVWFVPGARGAPPVRMAQEVLGDRDEAIRRLRAQGLIAPEAEHIGVDGIDKIIADARANLNRAFLPGPNAGAAAAAAKSLEDLTKSFKTGGNAMDQINRQFAQDIDAIDKLVNQMPNDEAAFMNANLAYQAATDKRDLAIMESLKPLMQQEAQSRFSVSFEPNSQALIESMIRAQYGAGADNPQERMARAIDLQAKILADQKKLQEQQLEALRAIRNKPGAVFVGGAG